MKANSRDILSILRRFERAGEENVPRHIEMVKVSNPNPINTLMSFRFSKQQYFVLFDDTADDDLEYIMKQIRTKKSDVTGELLKNPTDGESTYAIPFKGKDCYLYSVISEKKRLDSELAERYPETSRSTWQKHIKAGHIKINGQIATSVKQDVTNISDISIELPEALDFSENSLPIIYIDDNVIVINKPLGVLSHAKGAITEEFTVADFFRRYTTYNAGTNRPGIIHRLDRDTSGVMIGARNQDTATLLQKQFADRKVSKTYFAILDGVPKLDKANIDLPIARNPGAPSTFRVDPKGKSATTRYEVLASDDRHSFVKLQPKTGRTHQLRVHMEYIGTPILGDKVYGKSAKRLYLHASSLEITIPTGDRRTFTTATPPELLAFFPELSL